MNSFIEKLNNAENFIEPCIIEDIDIHYEIIRPLVSQETAPEDLFKEDMLDCINSNTAYKTTDNSCFLYYIKDDNYTATGVCFYGKNNPKGMLTLLSGMFNVVDTDINLLRFTPHNKEDVKTFKSLVVPSSVKNYYVYGKPVILRVDLIREKIRTIGKMSGVK